MKRLALSLLTSGALLLGAVALAPAASAVDLTPAQLTDAGFPKKPNTAAWGGTAVISTHRAPQWQDVIITGKAADFTQPGQVLTMQRFVPTDTQGSGSFRDLAISTTVAADRSFALHFQIGLPGTFGYRVGYSTESASPEFVGFQFHFTTMGSGASAPNTGSASAVALTPRQLARAGFTRDPNITGWGGSASLSSARVQPGQAVTLSGRAPRFAEPGQRLELRQFVATDRRGSGHFDPTGVRTKVRKDGSFRVTFTPEQGGAAGYTLGYGTQEEWVGVEFQVVVRG
jgi:hypothetical protein